MEYRLVSCPVCSCLCVHWFYGTSREIRDVPHRLKPEVTDLVGVESVVRQGFGITDGHVHRCPPALAIFDGESTDGYLRIVP